jgi:cellobiose phosphorylase
MVYAYIAETGDIELLDEVVKYADSDQTDTIYDHLLAALDYTARNTGEHGLPLILTADWNDTLHLWMEAEKPESVLVAELYIYGLKLMAKLARKMDKEDDAQDFIERADKMADIINKECWDGEWYLRGFGSEVIGTKESERAKLFLNTQSWALISGVANETRARKCMESVRKHLSSPEGLKLIWPPFDEYDQTYGLVSRYNIGRKENGIFAHANAWAVVAECILGRGDLAHEYYKNVLPLTRNDQADVLKTEPYVFCQTICSEDSINRGEGANSWLTGTASWMYVAVSEYLLGIKATLEGLKINPSIPKEWDGFTIRRKFRGDTYQIKVINSKENNSEDIKIVVDGKELPNQTIKPFNDGKTHQVELFY